MNKKYTVLDLFSGAGGLSLGFTWAGFDVVAGIDNMAESCETFAKNHPKAKVVCDDITKIDIKEFAKDLPKIDVILGGPPCQGMSLAGKRLSDDPRNILFKEFVRFVDFFKPKLFIMENVPGLLSMGGGKINEAILQAFKDIGYNNFNTRKPTILLAANYGVPQLRRRLVYLGTHGNISIEFPPPRSNTNVNDNDNSLFGSEKPYVTVGEAISDLPSLKAGEGQEEMNYKSEPKSDYQKFMRKGSKKIFNHVAPSNKDILVKLIQNTEPGKSVDPKYSDSKRWDANKPGFTVKALGAGGGSTNRRAFHYKDARGSTVRENARIQSFPDSYRFYGSKTMQMMQVGNAVPPLMAYAIALSVKKGLDKK